MAATNDEILQLYRQRAGRYDLWIRLFRLLGLDLGRYRQETVEALNLRPGDVVVELGCGTGLNFPYVLQRIGPAGRLIGVDLTDAMLDVARERAAKAGWPNVTLVQADLADYTVPNGVDAVYSTLALTLSPEYDAVVERASKAISAGGRIAVLDLKRPTGWPEPLVRLAAWLNRPFGVSLDLAERHPWESIRRNLTETTFHEYYFGALYLCAGERRALPRQDGMPDVTRDLTGAFPRTVAAPDPGSKGLDGMRRQ